MSRQRLEGPRCANDNCARHESESSPLTSTDKLGRKFCDIWCQLAQERRDKSLEELED